MAEVVAQEVMTAFNERSGLGRVVINPPERMAPLKFHDTTPMRLCCGRAFLSDESYEKHNAETEVHGKPLDLAKVRVALNDRDSVAFWRSRKANAARQSGTDDDDDDNDAGSADGETAVEGNEDDANESMNPSSSSTGRKKQVFKLRRTKGFTKKKVKRRYISCTLCNLSMPYCNYNRHMKTCHNPDHGFQCRFCCCTFEKLFGRISHETKAHTKKRMDLAKKIKLKAVVNKIPKKIVTMNKTDEFATDNAITTTGFVKIGRGMFKCCYCPNTYGNSSNARDHVYRHKGMRPYPCDKCHFVFTSKSNVRRHLKFCHLKEGISCPLNCGCVMASQMSINLHMHKCKSFSQSKYVSRIRKISATTKVKVPPVSPTKTPQNFKLAHIGRGPYQCNLCDKIISQPANYRDHLNTHTGAKPYECLVCGITFGFQSNLRRHTKTNHVIGNMYKCVDECRCTFGSQKALQAHLNSCIFNKSSLNINRDTFSKKAPTNSPVKRESFPVAVEKSFQCSICDKILSNGPCLRKHMMRHSDLKPFKCPICDLAFRSTTGLRTHHESSHDPLSTVLCPDCPCRFKSKSGYLMHRGMYHTGKIVPGMKKFMEIQDTSVKTYSSAVSVRPALKLARKAATKIGTFAGEKGNYPCDECGKILQSEFALRNHYSIHTGEKPFKCDMCGILFRLMSTLHDHKRSSHGTGNFFCNVCPCRFETESGLTRHSIIYHGYRSPSNMQRKANEMKRKALFSSQSKRFVRPMKTEGAMPKVESAERSFTPPSPRKNNFLPDSPKSLPKKSSQAINRPSSFKMASHSHSSSSSMFQCGHCGLSLPSIQALSDHQMIHMSGNNDESMESVEFATVKKRHRPSVSCPICSRQIAESRHLERHMKACHSGGPYECGFCPCSFEGQRAQIMHESRCHNNRSVQQEKNEESPVSQSTKSAAAGDVHLKTKVIPKTITLVSGMIKCEVCGKLMNNNIPSYQVHLKHHYMDKTVQCDICPLKFKTRAILMSHKKKGHGSGTFPCKTCPCRYATAKGLEIHTNAYHRKNQSSQEFARKPGKTQRDRLQQVANLETEEETVLFKPAFKLSGLLRLKPPKVRSYQCDICFQVFKLSSTLSNHKKKSHGSGNFHCNKCPSRFTTVKGLNVHDFVYHRNNREQVSSGRAQESDEAPRLNKYDDDEVDESSSYRVNGYDTPASSSYRAESSPSKSSPKNRPIKCKTCSKVCFGPADLRSHMESHQQQKEDEPAAVSIFDQQFDCAGCGATFSSIIDFSYHLQTDPPSEGYHPCSYCCIAMETAVDLRHHYELSHQQEQNGES